MFVTRVLREAAKKSTGLVGLPVLPDAAARLQDVYERTLVKVQEIPEGIPYRTAVEEITNYRMRVVKDSPDEAAVEKEVGFQLEELFEHAKDELELIDYLKDSPLCDPANYDLAKEK